MDGATATLTNAFEPEVKIYVGRLCCRVLSKPRHLAIARANTQTEAEGERVVAGSAPFTTPSFMIPVVGEVGSAWEDDSDDDDEMVVFEGDTSPTAESGNKGDFSTMAKVQERLVGAVRESLAYVGDTTHSVEENIKTKATALSEKAVDTLEKGRASAEEKSRQLEEKINTKVALLEEKTKATYSALDSSAMKYTQQLEGLLNEKVEVVTDKSKAAAKIVRTKSGEIASSALTKSGEVATTARTKSEELALSTRDKLQAAGQGGLRALAKTFKLGRGGA